MGDSDAFPHSFETPLESRAAEAERNWRSCADFALTEAVEGAVRRCAEKTDAAARVCCQLLAPANLVALQPNAHAGNRHLPRHHWPRHDGFGVVIITVAVRGAGTVVLENRSGDIVRFDLPEGHACLAGAARHAWLHGVVAPTRSAIAQFERSSIPDARPTEEGTYGWVDAACDAAGPAGDDGRGGGRRGLVCVVVFVPVSPVPGCA